MNRQRTPFMGVLARIPQHYRYRINVYRTGIIYSNIVGRSLPANSEDGLGHRCPDTGIHYSPWPCVLAEDFPMSAAPSTHIYTHSRATLNTNTVRAYTYRYKRRRIKVRRYIIEGHLRVKLGLLWSWW